MATTYIHFQVHIHCSFIDNSTPAAAAVAMYQNSILLQYTIIICPPPLPLSFSDIKKKWNLWVIFQHFLCSISPLWIKLAFANESRFHVNMSEPIKRNGFYIFFSSSVAVSHILSPLRRCKMNYGGTTYSQTFWQYNRLWYLYSIWKMKLPPFSPPKKHKLNNAWCIVRQTIF